jgi:hypothetical protein
MEIDVDPLDGTELERLITALLTLTGLIHLLVAEAAERFGADPVATMNVVALELRDVLTILPEHHSDADLAHATRIVAEAALIAHAELRP